MIYILISILMIIIGLIGIYKNKLPKHSSSFGFTMNLNYYVAFYAMVITGVIFLIIIFTSDS